MHIGERIKAVRKFRGMTQKELGIALGFPEGNAGTRVVQYELGKRTPKKEAAKAIAKALDCNYINFYDGADLNEVEKNMMTFFWLEEGLENGLHVPSLLAALACSSFSNYMREWRFHFEEKQDGVICPEEYFAWKLNWPYTCDDGGRVAPEHSWRNS